MALCCFIELAQHLEVEKRRCMRAIGLRLEGLATPKGLGERNAWRGRTSLASARRELNDDAFENCRWNAGAVPSMLACLQIACLAIDCHGGLVAIAVHWGFIDGSEVWRIIFLELETRSRFGRRDLGRAFHNSLALQRKLVWSLVLGYRRLLRGSGEWSTHLISVASLSDYRYHPFRASPLHIGGKWAGLVMGP